MTRLIHFFFVPLIPSLRHLIFVIVTISSHLISSHLRYAALTIITEMYVKVGEPYLPLLAESMPYLYESLEDPDDDVAQVGKED